jgi:predicted  nucleic acid-binding Zn-ribbon protein
VERAIQDQTILQMGAMVVNPAFGINPEKWFEQLAKSKRLNPKEFRYTEAEKEKMAQKQPPPAPAVQAAQVRAASAEKIAAAELQADTQARQESLAMERELAMLKYANDRGLTLEQVKAQLAEAAMKINLQRELSQDARIVDLHKHHTSQAMTPPVEPEGRAPAGEAFAA